MRCPDCNKFVPFEEAEPEVGEVDLNDEAVSVDVRIVNTCAECGTELTESSLTLEGEFPDEATKAHQGEGHELSAEECGCERIQSTEGKGRGTKTFYGASVEIGLHCSCQDSAAEPLATIELSDTVQASSMDQLV